MTSPTLELARELISRPSVTPSDGPVQSYGVYLPFTCGCYVQVSADDPGYTLSSLAPGSYECAIVYAANQAGYSGWSNWACGSTFP